MDPSLHVSVIGFGHNASNVPLAKPAVSKFVTRAHSLSLLGVVVRMCLGGA